MKAKKTALSCRVSVENINVPGHSVNLDGGKYEAMRKAIIAVMPKSALGLSQMEIRLAVVTHLPEALYPRWCEGRLVGKDGAVGPRG